MANQPTPTEQQPQSGGNRALVIFMGVFILVLLLAVGGLLAYIALTDPADQPAPTEVARNPFATSTPIVSLPGQPTAAPSSTPAATETEEVTPQVTNSPVVLPTLAATDTPAVQASPDTAQAVALLFSAPVGSVASAQVQSAGSVQMTAIPVVQPTAISGTPVNACGMVDENPMIDPSGDIFPSWDGFDGSSDELRQASWPEGYVEYLEGQSSTRDNPAEITLLPGYILVGSGDAVEVTGDVQFETFEAATAFAIGNFSADTVTLTVTPKNTNTFLNTVRPLVYEVDSMRAVVSYYAGGLLHDNQALERVGFRFAIVSPDNMNVLQGIYVRDCGTITGAGAQALSVQFTPVPDSVWEQPFTAPARVEAWPLVGELQVAVIDQARADNGFGCNVIDFEEPVSWMQCSAQTPIGSDTDPVEIALEPQHVLAGFANFMTIRNEAGEIVFENNSGNEDLPLLLNDSDETWNLTVVSQAPGYLVIARPAFIEDGAEWTPEMLRAYGNHLIVASLKPELLDMIYNNDQETAFEVPLATAVAPCEQAVSGCSDTFTQIIRWDGENLFLYWNGIVSDALGNNWQPR